MVGGPVFGPQPRIKQAFFVAAIIVMVVAVVSLLVGCASPKIEYQPIPAMLIPLAPALPTIKAAELACLSDDAYLRLAARDRMLRQYAAELEALLNAAKRRSD